MTKTSYEPLMETVPLFISWPRSGSHWINCVMELYFQARRYRKGSITLLPSACRNYMWFHDHDLYLTLNFEPVLYLYRNPVDCIYSYSYFPANKTIFVQPRIDGKINPKYIEDCCDSLNRHYDKYLNNKHTIIKYENFKADFGQEFNKILAFFDKSLDQQKLDGAIAAVTKERLISKTRDKNWMGPRMVTDNYQKDRELFHEEWTDEIFKLIKNKRIVSEYYENSDSY